ncbi:MAG TPA: phage tail sheath C-terminal domain-containing protein [Acidimicrobiales bacterium]|nr:phage tail sheath C-terminal domain-containing protein [Acidimicrobiales bacterium]
MPTYLTPGVYVEEIDRGSKPLSPVGTAVAAFVGFTAKAPTDDPTDPDGIKPRYVTNWGQYVAQYGGFETGAMLPHAVYGYFNNGGGACYIVRIPNRAVSGPGPARALPSADDQSKTALQIASKVDDPDLQVDVVPDPTGGESFTLNVRSGDQLVETFPNLTLGKGERAADKVVTAESRLITVTLASSAKATLPATGTYTVDPAATTPKPVTGPDFTGDEADRHGIGGLVIAEDVTMLAVPDLITAARGADGSVDLDLWKAVQVAMLNHCESQANRMALLDAPPNMKPLEMKQWRSDVAMYDSKFGTLYYPWIQVANPGATNGDRIISVPPCGHVAGVWGRNDETRGVWKAPANEVVRGALDVSMRLTKEEQAILNPIGVNCIRTFGTRGIRVWGARTLSSDQSWQYVNVRRLFNMIETTIMEGTQWVVFEPNDKSLWERVKRTISVFLLGLWREGALFGATPEQAYYVKCDEETNTQDSIDLGRLIVEVGIAPVKPAEFVIFRISQWQGGSGSAE